MSKYQVITETKGILYFDELPHNTYFLSGFQDENDKGLATYMTFDRGTCLLPILDMQGNQVRDISRAGEEIKRR